MGQLFGNLRTAGTRRRTTRDRHGAKGGACVFAAAAMMMRIPTAMLALRVLVRPARCSLFLGGAGARGGLKRNIDSKTARRTEKMHTHTLTHGRTDGRTDGQCGVVAGASPAIRLVSASDSGSNSSMLGYLQWIGFNWPTWLVIAASLIAYYTIWCNSRFVRLIRAIPGPVGLPVLGSILDLNVDQVEFLKIVHRDWVAKYGDIYAGWGGMRAMVTISAPELMEPILSSQKLITKGKEYSYLSRWLGDCMFLTTGSRWRSRRRLLTPAFHFQILESFFDVFNEQSKNLIADLDRAASANSSQTAVNVYTILTQCALDIICDSSMGRQVRKREETKDYLHSVNRIMQITMERSVRPWLENDLVFNLSPLGRENRECVRILHDFTNQVIRDRRRMLSDNNNHQTADSAKTDDESPKRRLAFLDLLIEASANGDVLSDDDIREEVDTFMFAGHDTTATAMGWFLYNIAKHPHEQKLLFAEVDEIFDDERTCTPQDAAELKYLECCIKETLRLYPSIPGIIRTLTEDTVIGGYTLPAGVSVALLIYGMHRNPRVYPDPDAFKPERFLPEHSAGRHPYAFIPFSAGPRNCIGQKYALFELKVVLSWILRKFEFSLPEPGVPTRASSEIVLKPVDGIHLVVKRRQTSAAL